MSDETAYIIAATTVAAFGGPVWAGVVLVVGAAIAILASGASSR